MYIQLIFIEFDFLNSFLAVLARDGQSGLSSEAILLQQSPRSIKHSAVSQSDREEMVGFSGHFSLKFCVFNG